LIDNNPARVWKPGWVKLTPHSTPRSKLIKIKPHTQETSIKVTVRFRNNGTKELIKLGYYAGFGGRIAWALEAWKELVDSFSQGLQDKE
jgi:hypothetical protein